MKISIIGGTGTVGHGIYSNLSRDHDVSVFGSDDFDNDSLEYKKNSVFECDVFIHAAGITDELVVENLDSAVFKANTFVNYLVDNLKKSGCSHIIYISTIHVFGDLSKEVSHNVCSDPRSIYSLLHYNTERMFQILLENTGVKFLCLRVPTIYGFAKDKGKLNRPNIIQFGFPLSLLENDFIKLKSSGNQYRLFASNFKVGAIVNKWIGDNNKDQYLIDVVQGTNITVKDFAKSCIGVFSLLTSRRAQLIIDDRTHKSGDYKIIRVVPYYDCTDEYTLNNFLTAFFQYHLK